MVWTVTSAVSEQGQHLEHGVDSERAQTDPGFTPHRQATRRGVTAASSTAGDAEGWATGMNFIAYDLAAMILLTHLFLVTEQRRKAFRRVPRPLKLLSAVCMLWLPVRITLNEYVNPRPPRSVNFLCNLFMYLYPNDR